MIYLKLFLTAVFWGGTFIAGRQVSQHLGPFSIAFLRFAVASVFLLGLLWIQEGRLSLPGKSQILPVLLLGITGIFAYNVLFFMGLRLIEAGRASLIVATCPAFIAVASSIFLKERLSPARIVGIPLSVFGAIVVISRGHVRQLVTGGVGLGELFILGCVLSWVAYSLIGKVAMRRLSPLASVTYPSLIGAAFLLVPAVLVDDLTSNLRRASLIDWTSIMYLAVFGTVVGFVWFYEGVKAIGPTRAGLFINFVPISAVILAGVLLHEQVTLSLAVGAALVLSGVYLTNRTSGR
ncbi:MAG: DMT family transporter [Sedimentisphaerales bacterium]|nr:DMT family transporter [Sedimentisphaerales bacterium]